MLKPFIHPDILLTVKQSTSNSLNERLDALKFEDAKNNGKEAARKILAQLFTREEYGNIESHFNTERLNSGDFSDIREQIVNLHYQRDTLTKEVKTHSETHENLERRLVNKKRSLFRFLFKKKIEKLEHEFENSKNHLASLKDVENESYLSISYEYDTTALREKYSDLISSFTTLKSSSKIWDMTYSERNTETKAAANRTMSRTEVNFWFGSIDVIQTSEKTFHFENANGGDFYFYPSFIVYFKSKDDIAILDYNDLHLNYSESQFLEENANIPSDTKTIGDTWYRVNKDGSPDRRFVNNYKIPIVLYGSLHFKTESGVNELYYISDVKKAKHFSEQYSQYQTLLRQSK